MDAASYLDTVSECLKTEEGRAALRALVELPPVEWSPTPEAGAEDEGPKPSPTPAPK